MTLWHLGYPDQAQERSHAALCLAQKLAHPFSEAFALDWAVTLDQHCRKEWGSLEQAEALITLSTEHELPHSLIGGILARGWALVEQGKGEEGLIQLRQGLAAYRDAGAKLEEPTILAWLAEAYGKVGQVEEGLALATEALERVDKTGERIHEAELYRLKGELTLQQESKVQSLKSKVTEHAPSPKPQASKAAVQEAERDFLKAIDIARKQQTKSFELQATTSLARLWQQQGKVKQAHTMLSAIYNWFTEGFDTKDLQEAKTLIEELKN